jgi:hypothetical protein
LSGGVAPVVLVTGVALILSIENRDRKTRLQCGDPFAEGQFIQKRCYEAMLGAEGGDCTVAALAEFVLKVSQRASFASSANSSSHQTNVYTPVKRKN